MRLLSTAITTAIALAALSAGAVVYLPGTQGKMSRPIAVSELPGIRPKPLHTEKVVVNGVSMTLELYQMQTTLGQVVRTIKRSYLPEHLSGGDDFVKAVFKKGNTKERWLFVATPERPVTAFYLKTEGAIPRPVWPPELPPLPAGAQADMVMNIPRLNAVYGAFSNGTSASGADMLASYTARMASAGWFHAGAEHSPAIRNSGEVYFRNTPERQILWIKFSDDGNGAFYLKKQK
ncbi:MAG: hypothetical protein IKC89_01760 [Lentisphaeria bacterium]|nr:hypothetical protein [Lentisphaeria bacterium]